MRVLFALSVTLCLFGSVRAEEPVYFPDEHLKAAVEEALWTSDPTPTDMLGLTSLDLTGKGIARLDGLEYAANLESLCMRWNSINDLSPLSGLTNLRLLDAHLNGITSITALSGLTNLETLVLRANLLADISVLAGLVKLKTVHLEFNQIEDVSPLFGLTNLTYLNIKYNLLTMDALPGIVQQIRANNPGIVLEYDSRKKYSVRTSSTAGGSVILPGEGSFLYEEGLQVGVTARADPGFVFVGWSGTYLSRCNPTRITIQQRCEVRANFVNALNLWYVDDDAVNDPGRGDSGAGDPQEDGTAEHPFDGIQEAIDAAADGTVIFVHSGTYHETIDLRGKRIELTGFDPSDSAKGAWPVIDGGGNGPVISFTHGEDANCVLQGFVITGGKDTSAAAIRCSASSPTIANCLIVGNCAADEGSAAVYCTDSSALLINCTMADNCVGRNGAALRLENSAVLVVNSILWGNTPGQIVTSGARVPSIRYSCIGGGWSGAGNIDADPEFASLGLWVNRDDPKTVVTADHPDAVWVMGDYHLQSQVGRWDAGLGQWVRDGVTSPCIDAGDPACPVDDEPSPDGGVIDIGAYGGTAEASLGKRPLSR
jgi:hypothetical protein